MALKQEKGVLSQFWRPEGRNRGLGRATLPLKQTVQRGILLYPFQLLGAQVFPGLQPHHSDLCVTLPAFLMAPVVEYLVFLLPLLIYISM